MGLLKEYNKSDFKQLTWDQYGKNLRALGDQVEAYLKQHPTDIHAVVPIMRGGQWPGTYLAYRLRILSIMPVQYRYFIQPGKPKIDLKLVYPLQATKESLGTDKPTFLLVENNHCFGTTAQTAAQDIKKTFPKCKIIYVADYVDQAYQANKFADVCIFGTLTNACLEISNDEARQKGIDPTQWYFPWEHLDEEWTTVQGKQPPFRDLERARAHAKDRLTFDLD